MSTSESTETNTTPKYRLTDVGNAMRLRDKYGQWFRYCHVQRRWYVWLGKNWVPDRLNKISHAARRTVEQMFREFPALPDSDHRKHALKHALASEDGRRLEAMVNVAGSMPELAITPEMLDTNQWLLNVQNGTVDLKTGALQQHDPKLLITKLSNAKFDPDASCPKWDEFMLKVTANDALLVAYIQRLIGYALTGEIREHIFVLFHGTGANGKSTFCLVIMGVLGDYAAMMPAEMLIKKRFGGNSAFELAELMGVRLAIDMEIDAGARLDVPRMKRLTGGDRIKARKLYQDYCEFAATHKAIFCVNSLPEVPGGDGAAWRRIQLVPWKVSIPEKDQDPELKDKLLAESDGILAWAIRGCLEWQRQGLNPPPAVVQASSGYQSEMDDLGAFLRLTCEEDAKGSIQASKFYECYKVWADREGVDPITQTKFGRQLRSRGLHKEKDSKSGRMFYMGHRLAASGRKLLNLPDETEEHEAIREALAADKKSQEEGHKSDKLAALLFAFNLAHLKDDASSSVRVDSTYEEFVLFSRQYAQGTVLSESEFVVAHKKYWGTETTRVDGVLVMLGWRSRREPEPTYLDL